MAALRLKPYQTFLAGIFVIGCLPALVILAFLRFKNGELFMFEQNFGPYPLSRILAVVLSSSAPLIILLPLGLTSLPPQVRGAFIGPAIAAPVMFVLPTMLAGMLVGADGLGLTVQAALLLVLFHLNFCLWFRILTRVFSTYTAILIYGSFWAISGFLDYVARYVAPYQDLVILKATAWLNYGLPPLGQAFHIIDELLASGAWQWSAVLPVCIQIPILIALLTLIPRPD